MRNILLVTLICFSTSVIYSQKYMDEIVMKSCECISNISDSVEPENYTMELGLCMINVSIPYKKQLKKDFGVDIDNIIEDGEKLGGIIGSRMAGICPEELISMTKKTVLNKDEIIEEEVFDEEGLVLKIENNHFISFLIKPENGKTKKYIWTEFIETNEDLVYDYNSIEGKRVSLSYIKKEYFDPKINDYRIFFIIKKLEIIN